MWLSLKFEFVTPILEDAWVILRIISPIFLLLLKQQLCGENFRPILWQKHLTQLHLNLALNTKGFSAMRLMIMPG